MIWKLSALHRRRDFHYFSNKRLTATEALYYTNADVRSLTSVRVFYSYSYVSFSPWRTILEITTTSSDVAYIYRSLNAFLSLNKF
jgi:hypothetical protein